jgi:hypothetical protein
VFSSFPRVAFDDNMLWWFIYELLEGCNAN